MASALAPPISSNMAVLLGFPHSVGIHLGSGAFSPSSQGDWPGGLGEEWTGEIGVGGGWSVQERNGREASERREDLGWEMTLKLMET